MYIYMSLFESKYLFPNVYFAPGAAQIFSKYVAIINFVSCVNCMS